MRASDLCLGPAKRSQLSLGSISQLQSYERLVVGATPAARGQALQISQRLEGCVLQDLTLRGIFDCVALRGVRWFGPKRGQGGSVVLREVKGCCSPTRDQGVDSPTRGEGVCSPARGEGVQSYERSGSLILREVRGVWSYERFDSLVLLVVMWSSFLGTEMIF